MPLGKWIGKIIREVIETPIEIIDELGKIGEREKSSKRKKDE